MKKLLILLLAVSTACQAQNRTTTITGNVKSLPDGVTVRLMNAGTYTRSEETVAEAVTANGEFKFTIQIDEPRFFIAEAGAQNGNYWFVVGPGEDLTMTGETFRNATVAGSKTYAEYEELYLVPSREYFRTIRNFPEEERPAQLEKYLDNAKKTIAENAGSFIAPVIMYQISGNVKPTEEMYEALSDEVKNSLLGRSLREHLDTFLINKPAPAFSAKDRDGKEHTLASLLDGNKYLVIDFWASWCAPCRAGIPEMKEFAKKYAGEGLTIVNISTDTDRDAWLKAMDEEQMPWANLHDETGVVKKAYGVSGIPSVFLIDVSIGKVVFEKLYGEAIGKELKKVFGY